MKKSHICKWGSYFEGVVKRYTHAFFLNLWHFFSFETIVHIMCHTVMFVSVYRSSVERGMKNTVNCAWCPMVASISLVTRDGRIMYPSARGTAICRLFFFFCQPGCRHSPRIQIGWGCSSYGSGTSKWSETLWGHLTARSKRSMKKSFPDGPHGPI